MFKGGDFFFQFGKTLFDPTQLRKRMIPLSKRMLYLTFQVGDLVPYRVQAWLIR